MRGFGLAAVVVVLVVEVLVVLVVVVVVEGGVVLVVVEVLELVVAAVFSPVVALEAVCFAVEQAKIKQRLRIKMLFFMILEI